MHDQRATLVAYSATLAAICYLSTVGAILAYFGRYHEAIGLAAAITGLIGVMRLPSTRSVTVDNPPSDPVPVKGGE